MLKESNAVNDWLECAHILVDIRITVCIYIYSRNTCIHTYHEYLEYMITSSEDSSGIWQLRPLVRNFGKFQTHVEAGLEPLEGTGYKQQLGLVMRYVAWTDPLGLAWTMRCVQLQGRPLQYFILSSSSSLLSSLLSSSSSSSFRV